MEPFPLFNEIVLFLMSLGICIFVFKKLHYVMEDEAKRVDKSWPWMADRIRNVNRPMIKILATVFVVLTGFALIVGILALF